MDFIVPVFTAVIGGVITLFGIKLTNRTNNREIASVAEQELRKDLINLHTENQKRIALLEKEMLDVREKNIVLQERNAELYEMYLREKDKVAQLEREKTLQDERITQLIEEKARLANQMIAMENEIRELRMRINGVS